MGLFNKKGDEYEALIKYLYQTLSEDFEEEIKVFSKYKIKGKSEVEHEIDVYYEFEKNQIIHKVIFECKDWNKRVSKEKLLTLKAIIDDIPNSVGVIVSKNGLQEGAEKFAKFNGIKIITGDKINILGGKILPHKLKNVLPDQYTKAEPFWAIMEKNQENNSTGNFFKIQDKIILFISKKEAEEVLKMAKIINAHVVGINKKHLSILIKYSEMWNWKIAIKNFFMDTIVDVSPEELKDNFYNI